MLKVQFYETTEIDDCLYKYAVIMAKHNGHWLFVRHKDRETWEVPGGRREVGESILKTAERELVEETGASEFELEPICAYSVSSEQEESFGHLYYAEVKSLGNRLEHEICEIRAYSELPEQLTYPLIQPHLYLKVIQYLERASH